MSKACVLVLGKPSAEVMAVAESAASMAGAVCGIEPSLEGLGDWIEQERPIAVVTSVDHAEGFAIAFGVRARFANLALPAIGLTSRVDDLVYQTAYASGLDDVCALDARQLGRRLRTLASVGISEVPRSEHVVVVADRDRNSRLLIGRVFRDAGYDVCFADSAQEALYRSADPRVRVVVCSAEIDNADGEPLSVRAPDCGSQAVWIINTPPKNILETRARIGVPDGARVAVHDAFSCPATLLFVANELMNRPGVEGRKSERLLYGSTVRFRHAGRSDEDCGYLYNLSAGGFYVQTLAAPARNEEVWLEFTPPRSDRLVHLEGNVVWARRYGPASGATVPCGFGVQITGGSAIDMERYNRSYHTFLAERVMQREVPSRVPQMDAPRMSA